MDGFVYHGSKVSGLKSIEPRKATHLKKWVYASKNPAVAVVFMGRTNDLFTCIGGKGTEDSPLYVAERVPNVFENRFNNSGFLYTLSGENFENKEELWGAEVVAENSQEVLKEEKIENVYNKLKELEENNFLKLYHYPDRPPHIPLDNRDLIDEYIGLYEMGHSNSIKNLLTRYPEFSDEVYDKLENKKRGKSL